MKQFGLFVVAAFFSLASQAHADFNGQWMGTGRVSNNKGMAVSCEHVVITIAQTASQMDIKSTFQCGTQMIAGPAGTLAIKGNEVFNGRGEKIGTVSADAVLLSSKNADGFMTSEEHLLPGNKMTFKTVKGDSQGLVTTFEGAAAL